MDIYYKIFATPSDSDEYLFSFRPDYYVRTILEDKTVVVTVGIFADKTWCGSASLDTLAKHVEKCHWKRLKRFGGPEVLEFDRV